VSLAGNQKSPADTAVAADSSLVAALRVSAGSTPPISGLCVRAFPQLGSSIAAIINKIKEYFFIFIISLCF
jgi:hypothetical protein